MKLFAFAALLVFACCNSVLATIYRDRAAFNAASQNLRTIDFENVPREFEHDSQIDGVAFHSLGGKSITTLQNPPTKALFANTVGEITLLTIFLPPGTTAVGIDQFIRPMIVSIPNGESVAMNDPNETNFVGFVTDQPIERLVVTLDFPEPTPSAIVDNLLFGQRRAGNEPPVPQLLVANQTGRLAALESVTTESEPFTVISPHKWAADGRTRVTLFVAGVALEPSDLSVVTVQAENAQQQVFSLPCEATGRVYNLSWMSQVTCRLTDTLIGAGDIKISVTVRGVTSNKATIRVD